MAALAADGGGGVLNRKSRRAAISIAILLIIWEIYGSFGRLYGPEGATPPPIPPASDVFVTWYHLLFDADYWKSWYLSGLRVLSGFGLAVLLGIPLGLLMAISRPFYGIAFPPFEVFRPIPPLAWVPIAIIFWPTQELSITFVTFLGAFTTIVINVLGGARSIDARYFLAGRSMGATRWDLFRRLIVPGTIPSIAVGAEVGMGITWSVVVAAEMISGGGRSLSGTGGGLGYFVWNSYVGGQFPHIIVGMFSIGIAGYAASAAIRKLGEVLTPWLSTR